MSDILAQGMPLTPMEMQVQQQALDRQRAIATILQQQSMTPADGQMVSGHYVKASPLQFLSKLAQGLMGKNQQSDLDAKQLALATQQGDMQRGRFGIGNTPQMAAPSQDQPSAVQSGLAQGAVAGSVGPTNDNAARVAQVAQILQNNPPAAPQPNASTVIPGMDKYVAFDQFNTDPKGYNSDYRKQFDPTEMQKNDRYLGIDASNSRAMELAKRTAAGMVTNRGFGLIETDPLTGRPRINEESMKQIERAKRIEGAFAAPITLKTSTGQEVQISGPEWADYQKSGNLPLRFLSPEVRQGLQADADKSGGAPANVNIKTDKGMVGGQITPQGMGQIGVSQTPFGQALDKDEAGRVSKMTEDVYDKGAHAIDKVAQNNKMIELLPSVTTGPLNKQITMIKNLGESLGINIGDPAPNQEFEKYAIQGALSAAKQIYGSRITNQDVTTQIMSNPGATMAEKAVYQMVKYDNEIQQRHIQKMSALKDYRASGGDLREFPVYFAEKYPFQGISAPASGEAQDFRVVTPPLHAPTTGTPSDDLYKQFGLTPKR